MPSAGDPFLAPKQKLRNTIHFLQTGMVFENVNPFSWIYNAISSEKSCLISKPFLTDFRTLDFSPPAESWLVNSNFPRKDCACFYSTISDVWWLFLYWLNIFRTYSLHLFGKKEESLTSKGSKYFSIVTTPSLQTGLQMLLLTIKPTWKDIAS